MSNRHELKRAYQERKKRAGVFQIKNKHNNKILLGSSLNIDGPLNAHFFLLKIGSHTNRELQADWNHYGADAFDSEILALVPEEIEGHQVAEELGLLEELWLDELQPFAERGYNNNRKIRQA
jgi:hypothetical protein